MRNWTFWEWLAYGCVLVAAMILAVDTGLKVAPALAQKLTFMESPYWGFAPFALVVFATCIFIAREFGFLFPFRFRRPFRVFLERDSASDLYGVQAFPAISYIQASVIARLQAERCRAWITQVHYRENELTPFALEQNERMPCQWSRHHSAETDFEIDLNRHDPAIRINIAVYVPGGPIQVPPETPSNLLERLQRYGTHRFEILFVALCSGHRVTDDALFVCRLAWHSCRCHPSE